MADVTRMLEQARAVQQRAMPDECRIERSGGVGTGRETMDTAEQWTLVWSGPCRALRADAGQRVIVTGETVTPAQPTVIVPWNVTGVRPDDRVTFTSSVSPGNAGRVLWVTDMSPRTFQSAVHLTCREVR